MSVGLVLGGILASVACILRRGGTGRHTAPPDIMASPASVELENVTTKGRRTTRDPLVLPTLAVAAVGLVLAATALGFSVADKCYVGCACVDDEKDPATCPVVHYAGVYTDVEQANMELEVPEETETLVLSASKVKEDSPKLFICGPAGKSSYMRAGWDPDEGESMPTRESMLADPFNTDARPCMVNPNPKARGLDLSCVEASELQRDDFYVTKVTCLRLDCGPCCPGAVSYNLLVN